MGKKYFIPGGNDFQEVVDQKGESIKNITAIQVYRDSIIVATKEKMFTNKPELFPGFSALDVESK